MLPDEEDIAFLPAVVLAELWIGILMAAGETVRKRRREKVRALLEATVPIPFTAEIAPTYARLYVELRRTGKPIPSSDLMIAATAVHLGHRVLVGKSDEAHFPRRARAGSPRPRGLTAVGGRPAGRPAAGRRRPEENCISPAGRTLSC